MGLGENPKMATAAMGASVKEQDPPGRHRCLFGTRLVSLAVVMALAGGCSYQRGRLVEQSQRVLREDDQTLETAEPAIEVSQMGSELSVRAEEVCQVSRQQHVEITYSYARESKIPVQMALMGVGGVVAGVLGGLFVANVFDFPSKDSVAPGDESSLTAESAVAGGVILLLASIAMVGGSAAHFIGLLPRDEEMSLETIDLGPQGSPAPCRPRRPLAGATVSLAPAGASGPVVLGTLDSDGELAVDAAMVVPAALALRHHRPFLPILVDGHSGSGTLELAPLRSHLDERVWAAAESTRCAAAEEPSDCEGLETYMQLFPDGAHAPRARSILESANSRLAQRAARLEAQRREREAAQQAEDLRLRQEAERRAAAAEQQWRAEQEQLERQRRTREADAAARQRAREAEAATRRRRADCRRQCAQSCSNDSACTASCVQHQCH